MNYYGYNFPFWGGQQNVLSRQSGDRLIKNDLLQLLLTTPGERVMRPEFGTKIKQRLFDGITENLAMELTSDINAAIAKYEQRVKATALVTTDEDNHVVNIKVSGYYTGQPDTAFELELNMPIGRTDS